MRKPFIFLLSVGILVCLLIFFWPKAHVVSEPKFKLEKLKIRLDEAAYEKLSIQRDTAISKGFLERTNDDFVSAKIEYLDKKTKAKVRLKGDWVDHLKENKWSFRVKLKSAMDDGLKVFSIQNPASRGNLKGYLYSKILQKEGVLSTEMRFVEVFVNDSSWGIYLLEEHLSSRMIENQNKPNGLIYKLDDQEYFTFAKSNKYTIGLVRRAKIKVYGDAKKEEKYMNALNHGSQIMANYREQIDTLYNSFDSDIMGKYYALSDLALAYHAMGWINIRFYYNFNSQKMEPIGYDAYPSMLWGKPYLGADTSKFYDHGYDPKEMVYFALSDKKINAAYYTALERVTDSLYIKEFLDQESDFINFYEEKIKQFYPNYSYDSLWLYNNARDIRKKMAENGHL